MARGKRPAPFRTRKLSLSAPMVLQVGTCGRVGHRRTYKHPREASVSRGCCSLRQLPIGGRRRRARVAGGWVAEALDSSRVAATAPDRLIDQLAFLSPPEIVFQVRRRRLPPLLLVRLVQSLPGGRFWAGWSRPVRRAGVPTQDPRGIPVIRRLPDQLEPHAVIPSL